MEHAGRGATALDQKDFSSAVTAYTKALIEHPTSPDYYVQRSTAFARLTPPRHDLALRDAEYAVIFGQRRAKREKIQAAQQRRVVSLYGLGRYADAKKLLDYMVKWRPKDSKTDKMEGDMWTAKVDSKLKTLPQDQRTSSISEYPDIELPSDDNIAEVLKRQLKADGSYNFDSDGEATTIRDHPTNGTSSEQTSTTASAVATTIPSSQPANVRHEWYQNSNSVLLTLYAKGVAKEKVKHQFEADSFSISFPSPANPESDYSYDLDPLCALINPDSSTLKVMSTKIEITLAKAVAGQKWAALEGKERPAVQQQDSSKPAAQPAQIATPAAVAGPAYPTSSKSGAKNWDKLANELTAKKPKKPSSTKNKKLKDDAKPDSDDDADHDDDGYESDYGGDAVDGFFKKLYAGADEDTRKAMMKSFQESNGTALSTNWSEVSKGKVEPVSDSKDDDK